MGLTSGRWVAALVVLLVSVTACADAGEGPLPGDYLAVVDQATRESQHARAAFIVRDQSASTSFEGVIDLVTGDMDMRGEWGLPEAAMASGLDDDGTVVTLGEPETVAVHMVVVDDHMYFGSEAFGGYAAAPVAEQADTSPAMPTADPSTLLSALAAEGHEPVAIGQGEVRGDVTSRFQIVGTASDGLRLNGVDIAPGTVLDDIEHTVTLDIDAHDRLRRVTTTTPRYGRVNGVIEVERDTTTASWELWDFGVDTRIETPTPVIELPEREEGLDEQPDSTQTHRRFSLTDGTRTGWMTVRFHPAGASIVLEGEVTS